jgi:4-carboxymuconolactone decarboxylase
LDTPTVSGQDATLLGTQYEMATTALSNSRWVPQGLYDRAVKALGHVGISDVITLMGYYTSVSMTLAFYDVPAGATGMAR